MSCYGDKEDAMADESKFELLNSMGGWEGLIHISGKKAAMDVSLAPLRQPHNIR
jgi:hypothetical protein